MAAIRLRISKILILGDGQAVMSKHNDIKTNWFTI